MCWPVFVWLDFWTLTDTAILMAKWVSPLVWAYTWTQFMLCYSLHFTFFQVMVQFLFDFLCVVETITKKIVLENIFYKICRNICHISSEKLKRSLVGIHFASNNTFWFQVGLVGSYSFSWRLLLMNQNDTIMYKQ